MSGIGYEAIVSSKEVFGFSYLLLYEKLIMPTWEPVLEQTLDRAFGCFAEVIGILRPCSYPRLHGPEYAVTW